MTMLRSQKWRVWVLGVLIALTAAGCSLLPAVKDETAGWSAE